MKKFVTSFLALLMIATCLAGCGGQPNSPANKDNPPADSTDSPGVPETSWPEKDIEIDVCYSAGGTADTAARSLGAIMGEYLGVNVNVVNVTGGSGAIAGQQVAGAKHDGYTWLGDVAHTASGWRVMEYADMSWEDWYGFYGATAPYVLFVAGNSQYTTYQELFDAMKANPGIKWGNAGFGSINQLTGQLMLDIVGLTGDTVPYNGGREAAVKVIAGEVVWSWCGVSDIMDLAVSGDVKILGVCDSNPLPVDCASGAYDAPSMLADYPELATLEGLLFWGVRVPRDTPADAVARIKEAFDYAVTTEEFAAYCEANSLTPSPTSGPESDEMCARLESIYAWGLYDQELAAEGVSPEDFGIPRIDAFQYPTNDRIAAINPWP
ncbi:MAG: hypothetical protein HFG09_07875 [Oscillibacter sp.]|nr:hypothetical protein [Oscillibacter sp.]